MLPPDASELAINSRFFTDSQSCFDALNADLSEKVELLEIKKIKTGTVTSINETNPIYTNTPEALEEFKKEHPEFDEYLETWNPHELMRLTYTTEEFDDEERVPILDDEKALMFRYVLHELEDDLLVPEGKLYIENASSLVH